MQDSIITILCLWGIAINIGLAAIGYFYQTPYLMILSLLNILLLSVRFIVPTKGELE